MNTNTMAKFILGLVAGLAIAASAQARTISLDSDPSTSGLQPLTSTSINRLVVHNVGETTAQGFPDQIRFRVNTNNDLNGGYNVGLSFVNVPLTAGTTTLRDITGLTFSLYKAVGAIGAGGGADTEICSDCGASFNQALLGGLYYAVVTGTLAGTLGGMYALTAAATVVPLPPAAWLLAAGLAGLVGIARRRKQGAAANPSIAPA